MKINIFKNNKLYSISLNANVISNDEFANLISEIDQNEFLFSYKEFIETIKTKTKLHIPYIYLNILRNGELHVFRSYDNLKYLHFLSYKIENNNIETLLRNIFKMPTQADAYTGTVSFTFASQQNKFTYITYWQVLNVLLTKATIESKGEQLYTKFYKTSKNGKVREIIAPHPLLKSALREENSILQATYDSRNSEFQVAYKKGKNIKTGAKLHKNNQYVFNIDLKDFYPSCKKELVDRYISFQFTDCPNQDFLKEEFFKCILYKDALFIGSPISGTLANAIISKPVEYLKDITAKCNMEFSVYADDMSFSSAKFISQDFIESIFNRAFSAYGLLNYFSLNKKKSHGGSGNNRKITGVSINQFNQLTTSRKYYREIRSMLNNLAYGKNVNIQKLKGKIAYARMIDESGKFDNYFRKFQTVISKYNLIGAK